MKYTLSKGNASAAIDSLGAEMVSYQKDGTEYLWGGNPESWAGCSPVLFPTVCSLSGGTARFDGVSYTLPKHGFARRNPFTLLQQRDDGIVFGLESSDATLEQYPYRFRLTIAHNLDPDGFSTTYEVTNQDDKPMPFCIGGHPGFLCPIGGEGVFDDYDLVFPQIEDNEPLLPDENGLLDGRRYPAILKGTNTIALSHALFAHDALIFDNLRSRSVTLKNRHTGRSMRFYFEGFPVLGVWTTNVKDAPYLCLEPWIGLPDFAGCSGDFEDKPHCVTLAPGESHSVRYAAAFL